MCCTQDQTVWIEALAKVNVWWTCFWTRHLTLTVPLFNWVLCKCITFGKLNGRGERGEGMSVWIELKHPIQSEIEISRPGYVFVNVSLFHWRKVNHLIILFIYDSHAWLQSIGNAYETEKWRWWVRCRSTLSERAGHRMLCVL